jgi:hypothetical protein
MKNIILAILLLWLSACVSGCAATIDSVQEHVQDKWNNEWKDALLTEVKSTAGELVEEGKDEALQQMITRLEAYDANIQSKLTALNVDINSHDTNNDGKMQLAETLALVKDIKEKNEKSPTPMNWWEIALIVAGAYLPTTAVKETLKSKISKRPPAEV